MRNCNLLLPSASIVALALSMPVAAQQASSGLEDIIVTAQKRVENVQNVPIAISAVSADYLESRDISSIGDLGTLAPNMKISSAPSSRTISQIAIRGSVTINPAITWEPAVGLYLDGIYIAKAQGSIFDIADLERVEVLRGPQGTLYGRNTLAGAVNLTTRKPTGELGGALEGSFGNYNYWRVKGSLDLPRFGIFSAKVSGHITKRDGLVKVVPDFIDPSPVVKDLGGLDSKSVMAQVRADLSDNLTADYMFDYSKTHQRTEHAQLYTFNRNGLPGDIFDPASPGYAGVPLFLYQNDKRQKEATIDGDVFERVRTYGHALTLSLDLGAAEVKSITAYRNLKYHDRLDLDGSPFAIALAERNSRYHSFSQELQVAGETFGERLNYVAGLYYFKDKATTLGPQSYFFGATTLQADLGSHTEAFAAYAQLDYALTDRLTLTGGLRYTHEKKDIAHSVTIAPGTPGEMTIIDILYGDVPDAKYNSLSPAATVHYQLTDDVGVYARYARGFKSGGFNGETSIIRPPTADCPSGVVELCRPYKPETVNSFELGFKSRMLDNRLQLNMAAFWNEHRQMQIPVFSFDEDGAGSADTIVLNAGSARIRGFELEWVAQPVDWFTFNGSFAYLDTKYKTFMDGGVDVANNRAFPHAPKFSIALGADWRVAEGDWGRFNLIGDLNLTSRYYTYPFAIDVPSPSDQTARTTEAKGNAFVNVRAEFADVPVGPVQAKFSVWAKNVFNDLNPGNYLDFGPAFGGMTLAYFPEPRTYGVTAGIQF